MARDWPAADVAPLIALIDDPRHKINRPTAPIVSPRRRRAPSSTCACSASPRSAVTRSGDELDEARRRDRRLSRHPALARAHPWASSRTNSPRSGPTFATPRRTVILDQEGEIGGRGPDPARGHGRHRVARRLHQARAALDLPGAAPRRQGPLRHADARRGFRHAAVRRQHPHAGAVLLLDGPRLQGEGLAACRWPRRRRAARR